MNRKGIWAAGVIVLLPFIFIGYLKIREFRSYQNSIHRDADQIIRINSDGITKTIALNFLLNPAYYLEGGSGVELGTKDNGSVNLPANLFLFNLKTKASDTFFMVLPLEDSSSAKRFASKKLRDLKIRHRVIKNGFSSADAKLTIIFNERRLALAYSPSREKVNNILSYLLAERNLLPASSPLLDKVKASADHIYFTSSKSYATLNFKSGRVELKSLFEDFPLNPASKVFHRKFSNQPGIKMWLSASLKHSLNKTFTVKDFTFHSDSLYRYYKGYWDFELGNTVFQQDTMVSYEYNDDFERVEKVTLAKQEVPEITARIEVDTRGLIQYLGKQNAIKEGQISKDLFPLYKLYIRPSGRYLNLSTTGQTFSKLTEPSPHFFYLQADFQSLVKQNQIPLLNRYFSKLEELVVRGKASKANEVEFEGTLTFKDENINSLVQLKKLFL